MTLDVPVRPAPRPALPPQPSAPPNPATSRADPNTLLALMCFALGLVIAANSSLSVAQPDIARALGASQTELTWVVNSYAMVFAALLLPAGIAADKYGRRSALLIGLLVFGLANVVSGFAPDVTTLIVLRAVAGLGATLVMPATLSVLVDSFPAERRSFAVSVWAGVAGAGALLGILITGLLLENFWWGSVQVLFGLCSLALIPAIAIVVPNTHDPSLPLDAPGGFWVTLGLGGLVYGVIEGPDQGWTETTTLAGLVGGGIALVVFVLVELRSPAPMLDVRLFRSRGLAAGSLLVTLLSVSVFGFFLIGPQFLQFINGYDTLAAALRMLPFAIGIVPATQLSTVLVARLGARWVSASGAAFMGGGLLVLGASADHGYPVFALGLVVTAFGMGLALPAGTALIIDGLPADRRTLSSAVNDVTREVGSAIGAAAFGSLLLTVYRRQVEPSLGGLPAEAAEAARDGVSGAIAVSPGAFPASRALVPASTIGFTEGFQSSMQVGAAILFGTAVLTAALAPAAAGRVPRIGAPATGTRRRSRRARVLVAIGVVAALSAGGVVGARYLGDAREVLSTDNAQIDGSQISIVAPTSGTLVGWRATRGTQLSRDMPVGRIRNDGGGFGRPQTVIRAPDDGVVGLDLATEGNYVSAGTRLATAYDLDGIYVTARIEEGDIGDVAVGRRVEMRVDAYPGTALTGAVSMMQGGTAGEYAEFVPADTTGDFVKVTQLVAVRIAIDDTRDLDLVPGMNVHVTMRRS